MKEEDKRIECRPELAKKLQEAMDFAIDIYSANIKKTYYKFLAKAYADEDKEKSDFINKAAKCFDGSLMGSEQFYEYYDRDLTHKYHVAPFSYENVGKLVFPVYQMCFDELKKECLVEGLSKSEQYLIKFFFEKLTAPLRNPNVVVHEGSIECFYDKNHEPILSFERAMKDSVEYIKRECPYTIDAFSLPDDLEAEQEEKE